MWIISAPWRATTHKQLALRCRGWQLNETHLVVMRAAWPRLWWIECLGFRGEAKVSIHCTSTHNFFDCYLHGQHSKSTPNGIFFFHYPCPSIYHSFDLVTSLLFHSWNINEMLCKGVTVQQPCGLQPQVRRHILSVITADINPPEFLGLKPRLVTNERIDDKDVLRESCSLWVLLHSLPF